MRTHVNPIEKSPSKFDKVGVDDPVEEADEADMSEDELDLEELIEALNTPLLVIHHEESTVTIQN